MKHIWIWFLRILLNFHQLATQSEQKQNQEKSEIVKNETSVSKQYAVMTHQKDFKEIFNSIHALNKYFKYFYCG